MAWTAALRRQLSRFVTLTHEDGTPVDATNPVPTKLSGVPIVTEATGTGAIALTYTNAASAFRLDAVTVKFSAAPAVAGNMTVTHKSATGAVYDVVLATTDPSVSAAVSIIVEGMYPCKAGDSIEVAYANPSARTYGAAIRVREA